jgi:hypothetical protein
MMQNTLFLDITDNEYWGSVIRPGLTLVAVVIIFYVIRSRGERKTKDREKD